MTIAKSLFRVKARHYSTFLIPRRSPEITVVACFVPCFAIVDTVRMNKPGVITAADMKPLQGPISLHNLLAFPEIQLALSKIDRWTPNIKSGVLRRCANRGVYDKSRATASESAQVDALMEKIDRTIAKDAEVLYSCFICM